MVGSHDTASAVVGVPADTPRFGYISCGTWGLVGVELSAPVLTEDSRRANFSNERGVDDTIRYLRNVMGLWLLSESVRTWSLRGLDVDLGEVLAAAAARPGGGPRIDPDDPVFLPPGDMPVRIAAACRAVGMPLTDPSPAAVVRCILDSLAALRGVRYRPTSAANLLRRNLLIYGLGGVVSPFLGIFLIDLLVRLIPGI